MRCLFIILLVPCLLTADIKIFLEDGSFSNGIIRTDKGGVIENEKIRIQATHLIYQKNSEAEMVRASGNLLILYDKRLLTGSHFSYNFTSQEGIVEDPVLASDGWIISGESMLIQKDGSIIIENGFIAPPSNIDMAIAFERIRLQRGSQIHARRLSVRLFKKELFCLNQIRTNLDALTDLPIQLRFSFGGYENTRASLRYRLIKTDEFKAYLRLDAVLTRGLGGGLDTNYQSRKTCFDSKAFAIHDRSWDNPDVRLRYRFQGVASDQRGRLNIRACYDWLSDMEMASNYAGKDFELPTAQRTELFATYKESSWLADFTTRVRINSFQTINQQLPGFQLSWRPFAIGPSGIMSDNRLKAAYLNYVFADGTPDGSSFASGRVEFRNRNYKNFNLRYVLFTPEAGFNTVYYTNSPSGCYKEQAVFTAGATASAPFFSNNTYCLHTVEPYGDYHFYSRPTAQNPYIFSIDDGYGLLNMLKAGFKQSFFLKKGPKLLLRRPLFFDFWAIGFFNAPALQNKVPRVYGAFSWSPLPTLETKFEAAWNRDLHSRDYANASALWTIHQDLAVKASILTRGARSWRKADPDNFMLDMIHSEEELQNSFVSDQRTTLIYNIFWRFHPNWTSQLQAHTGWGRPGSPAYNEYKINLSTVILSYWSFSASYERREVEERFSFGLKLIN